MVQAFRHLGSTVESCRFRLSGLDGDALYSVANVDASGEDRISGRELMEKGLRVASVEHPGAAIITYKRCDRALLPL